LTISASINLALLIISISKPIEKGIAIGERQISKLFALWESGVSLAEAKRKFGLGN